MLSRDVVSSPSDPRYRQPMSLDTEARLNVISAAHLYTMPDFHLRLTFTNRAGQRWACCLCPGDTQPLHERLSTWSAHDHQYKSFGRHAGVGVQHAKPITTRLAKLDKGRELARRVGLGG